MSKRNERALYKKEYSNFHKDIYEEKKKYAKRERYTILNIKIKHVKKLKMKGS